MLIVPLFSIYRTFGLINSLSGLALVNVVFSVSFATIILAGFFRRIPQDLIDAGRFDGAGRLALLIDLGRDPTRPPGIVAVAVLVARVRLERLRRRPRPDPAAGARSPHRSP